MFTNPSFNIVSRSNIQPVIFYALYYIHIPHTIIIMSPPLRRVADEATTIRRSRNVKPSIILADYGQKGKFQRGLGQVGAGAGLISVKQDFERFFQFAGLGGIFAFFQKLEFFFAVD